jgi:hypothetical protein
VLYGKRQKAKGRRQKDKRQEAVSYDLRSPPRMKVRTFYLEVRRQEGKGRCRVVSADRSVLNLLATAIE